MLGQREKDTGESERRPVIGRIGVVTSLHCESRPTSSWQFVTKRQAEPTQEEIANERRTTVVCILPSGIEMGPARLASHRAPGAAAASTHRKGNAGETLGPGEIPAMAAHPLVQRARFRR